MRKTLFLASLAFLLATSSAFAGVTITIQNNDAAGLGFNDPTPAAPLGGNPGTTLGEQRLNAFKFAAGIWGNILESKVPIVIRANFSPITNGEPCTGSSAILGQAGPTGYISDFTNAPQAHVGYSVALANALSGTDLNGVNAEISAQFNSLVDNATCLGNSNWYYGFDGNHGGNIDLVEVLLHEFAHGLGFAGNTSTNSGNFGTSPTGNPTVFDTHIFDTQAGLRWNQMTPEQRLVSMVNTGHLAWDGPNVKAHAATLLRPITILTVNAPSSIAHRFDIGTAAFGSNVTNIALTGDIVAAQDASDTVGPSTTDGCSAFTNASAVHGKWALVDRGPTNGNCTFVLKAQNAQAAGAVGLIVADNRKETCFPPGMSGTDASITIPVVSLTQDDGALIRAQTQNGVNATLHTDPTELAGSTTEGYTKLYAPCTISAGSSIYHFDITASPNLLMEPNINDDLTHTVDLTVDQLRDIGWPITSPQGRTILRRR
ncbi:MAG TPA: PA domain-containing protein [Thermoanaerobaculia bacterium]|nr:PA domain-containing protein [Thermoanaerobaculia bacterium]